MKMICMQCQGLGVVIKMPSGVTILKQNVEEVARTAEKVVCPMCNGTGEIESGFMARKLGLTTRSINEGETR